MNGIEHKIDVLIEEGLKTALAYGLPLVGAVGLGYLGHEAGSELADGVKSVSDRNDNIIDSLSHITKQALGAEKSNTDIKAEFQKFFTPGEDGSWRSVGEALGNDKMGNTGALSDKHMAKISNEFKLNGAIVGTGLGYLGGKLISPNKK